jgi:hypothetical protein
MWNSGIVQDIYGHEVRINDKFDIVLGLNSRRAQGRVVLVPPKRLWPSSIDPEMRPAFRRNHHLIRHFRRR